MTHYVSVQDLKRCSTSGNIFAAISFLMCSPLLQHLDFKNLLLIFYSSKCHFLSLPAVFLCSCLELRIEMDYLNSALSPEESPWWQNSRKSKHLSQWLVWGKGQTGQVGRWAHDYLNLPIESRWIKPWAQLKLRTWESGIIYFSKHIDSISHRNISPWRTAELQRDCFWAVFWISHWQIHSNTPSQFTCLFTKIMHNMKVFWVLLLCKNDGDYF